MAAIWFEGGFIKNSRVRVGAVWFGGGIMK